MTGLDLGAMLAEIDPDLARRMFATKWGSARHTKWRCRDGWIVGYSTERIEDATHEPYNGKFAAFAYKPVGKGARSGDPEEWKMVYFRVFAKRKTARARAEALYEQHSGS